ncbi:MAG: Sau3AI family type II restriction endonuclease [Firmicutes bacterium]|nr:Sau3AI family type II restriction endonuclease [Bacillota bacterium]
MDDSKHYDKTNPLSIESYAQNLIGKTFANVCLDDDKRYAEFVREVGDYAESHENKKRKGGLGELIEERFFHYQSNNDSRPDFDEAGVELKVTPYKINRNGSLAAKERLIITMIDYFSVINEKFEISHLWKKAQLILLIYYLYQKEIENRLEYKIGYVKLFSPPAEDIKIIKSDFEVIVEKIKSGKAHELSESDTMYLGAAPKASTSKDRRKQPFSDVPAKPRAFAFKNSYMTYVLNNYMVTGKVTFEKVIKSETKESFEEYVVSKINSYRDYTVEDLCKVFDIKISKSYKHLGAMIAYRILGIKSNHAEEFEKANIVVKTIRIGKNNKIKESMSFTPFKFKELVEEEWDNCTFGSYLRETRFFFVIYKFDENDKLLLKGCQFWNMPYSDIEEEVKKVWKRTQQVLIDGLQITKKNGNNYNNLPNASENKICHVRPHARNADDMYELPDGRLYTKQSFWLNNSYILSQIKIEY